MTAPYTQVIVRSGNPRRIAGVLKGWDVLIFAPFHAGSLICERTSETTDLRIIGSMAQLLSRHLETVALAVAGEGPSFWCALFENGKVRFEHNRLTGPREWQEKPAEPAEMYALCSVFGKGDAVAKVQALLADPRLERAIERHAALTEALGLPKISPGVGYSGALAGALGLAVQPRRSTLRSQAGVSFPSEPMYSLVNFKQLCGSSFGFLVDDFAFRELPSKVLGYPEPYLLLGYGSRHLFVVIEGSVFGALYGLYLVDREGRFLSLTSLVEHRDPERLELCALAMRPSEQVPNFAAALYTCAADLLAGDLSVVRPIDPGRDFVFGPNAHTGILKYCQDLRPASDRRG